MNLQSLALRRSDNRNRAVPIIPELCSNPGKTFKIVEVDK